MAKSVVTAVCLLVLFASYASAGQTGDYVGASAGLLLSKHSTVTDRNGDSADLSYNMFGASVSAFIGRQYGMGLRVEEELFYKRAATDKFNHSGTSSKIDSNMSCLGAMTNLYYDWYHDVKVMEGSSFSPYVGVGVGFVDVNMSDGTVNGLKLWNGGSDAVLAYQIAIGSGIPINKDIVLDISYRYFSTQDSKIDQIKTNFSNHNILLGARYFFR